MQKICRECARQLRLVPVSDLPVTHNMDFCDRCHTYQSVCKARDYKPEEKEDEERLEKP